MHAPHWAAVQIETHAGECDDHDSCTIIDTCKIVDGSCSGTPRRCPFPCHACSADSGECEYTCYDGQVCEHDECVYAPDPEPECHTASDCPDPGCQDCHHGYCKGVFLPLAHTAALLSPRFCMT